MSDRLRDAWTYCVAAAPSAVIVLDDDTGQTRTRAALDDAAQAWAARYRAAVAGQTVAIAAPNSFEWLGVFVGLLRSDAVILPLDPGDPVEAQQATARACGATHAWSHGALHSLAPRRPAPRDGRVLLKLTSGSTGAPRPLRFTDRELLADARHICAAMDIRSDDRNLGLIPWGHSYALGNIVVPLLAQGTAVVCGVAPLPNAIAAAMARRAVTVFPAVPALLRALAESAVDPVELRSLRTVISAGAALAPEVAQAFTCKFGLNVHSFYGSSETGGITYDASGESAVLGRGVGRPLPGVSLEFGRGGRFVVHSGAVFTLGNLKRGAHRMPDIARLAPDGELVLLGRAGRFMKIAGRRLNLAEVEQALRRVTGVRDAFVAPQGERTETLAAAVATELAPAQVREALRPTLASWKIPKRWIILREFPLTPRGKPDTRQLRALLARDVA